MVLRATAGSNDRRRLCRSPLAWTGLRSVSLEERAARWVHSRRRLDAPERCTSGPERVRCNNHTTSYGCKQLFANYFHCVTGSVSSSARLIHSAIFSTCSTGSGPTTSDAAICRAAIATWCMRSSSVTQSVYPVGSLALSCACVPRCYRIGFHAPITRYGSHHALPVVASNGPRFRKVLAQNHSVSGPAKGAWL